MTRRSEIARKRPRIFTREKTRFLLATYGAKGAKPRCPMRVSTILLTDQSAQQRDRREQHHENDRDIKDQFFNPTACFKARARAWRAERAAQASAAYLEKNEENDGYAQDNLNDANRRKPLLQNSSSLS